MYKPCVSPEAASDIVEYTLNNPDLKFDKAIVVDLTDEAPFTQAISFYFTKQIGDETVYQELQIPVETIFQLLKFSLSTLTASRELSNV